jgi:hypothetical protein
MPAHKRDHVSGLDGWATQLNRKGAGMRDRTSGGSGIQLMPPLPRARSRLVAGSRPHGLAPGELVKLHHSLLESIDADSGIVAQFVSPEPDSGIRDVVYDLAHISADWLGKRVLFVDGTAITMKDGRGGRGPDDIGEIERSITRVVGLDLYQMTFPSMRGMLELTPTVRLIPEFMRRLRENFELVLIAAPAASEAPMAMLLSRFVDGNILVLEAGRTRAPVAVELRDSLRTSGGTVVGAVLTHYNSFIPNFLRNWL